MMEKGKEASAVPNSCPAPAPFAAAALLLQEPKKGFLARNLSAEGWEERKRRGG